MILYLIDGMACLACGNNCATVLSNAGTNGRLYIGNFSAPLRDGESIHVPIRKGGSYVVSFEAEDGAVYRGGHLRFDTEGFPVPPRLSWDVTLSMANRGKAMERTLNRLTAEVGDLKQRMTYRGIPGISAKKEKIESEEKEK